MGKLKKTFTKIFTIIGIVVTLVGFYQSISYIIHRQYREEKEITLYDYDSEILIKNKLLDKVKIYYDDIVLENLYYKSFTIKNTGIEPINPNDYIENICIKVTDNTILDAQIISYSNSYIKKNIIEKSIIEENKVCFPNILLNSDDYFQINIITKKAPKHNYITGVVSGINKININNSNTTLYKLNVGKKVAITFMLLCLPFVIYVIYLLFIEYIFCQFKEKKFIKIFKCDKEVAKLLAPYYFKKIKSLKKNGEKNLKPLDKEVKKFIKDMQKNNNESK